MSSGLTEGVELFSRRARFTKIILRDRGNYNNWNVDCPFFLLYNYYFLTVAILLSGTYLKLFIMGKINSLHISAKKRNSHFVTQQETSKDRKPHFL